MLDTNRNHSDVRERDTDTSPNAALLQGDAAAYPTTQKELMFQILEWVAISFYNSC